MAGAFQGAAREAEEMKFCLSPQRSVRASASLRPLNCPSLALTPRPIYYYYYDYQEEERLYNIELQLVSKIEQNGLGLEDRVDL